MPDSDTSLHPLIDSSIFDLLGLQGISQSKKNELASTMMETVQGRITDRLLTEVEEENVGEFEAILDQGDDALEKYLEARNIDFQKLVAEEIIFYKVELVNTASRAVAAV